MAPKTSSTKIDNPNEYLAIPKWINEDYFDTLLRNGPLNYSKIISFTPIAATPPGENYTSVMVRVLIDAQLNDGSTTEISYILKTMLDSATNGAAVVNAMNLFPKELQMYQTILPKCIQLYKEAGVDVQLGPTCLYIDETPERVCLVMEDLKQRSYMNADRLKGLDMEHITLVLHKLAELHAATARFYELNGPFDEMYHSSFFNEANRPFFKEMTAARQNVFIRAMREWGLENVDYYIEKTPEPSDQFDEGLRLNATNPSAFNVLNHGDCWINNVMFKYDDDEKPHNVLLLDFQVGKWGPPAHDLWYMILTSASLDIKVDKFDYFIATYHTKLVECLKLLKYSTPLPTLRQMHIMMLDYGFWALLTANGVMSAMFFPSDKDASIENMMKPGPEGDTFRYKVFSSPYYARAMCQLCPFFDNKGILDIVKS